MIIEISIGIIALTFLILAIILIKFSFQTQRSIQTMQSDVHNLSTEILQLVHNVNDFVQADLHTVSEETSHLISKLTSLSSDVNNKSHSLNFLFKPFHFLTSKLSSDESKNITIPQVIKWIASSVLLFKTTKEFIKNYEKRKQ
jgi:uncharacterized protein YoxC